MTRREIIAGLGSAAAWPVVAGAQQPAMPVIGYLHPGTLDSAREPLEAFHRGLSEAGFVEGRNLVVEYRWAEGHADRLLGLAEDLVRHQVAVIVAMQSTAGALAAKAATRSIPILFAIGSDPVDIGLVASLNRPGGNLTGISFLQTAFAAKRLELLHELLPAVTLFACLVNPANPVFADSETKELQIAARTLGVRLLILNARDPREFPVAFETLVREQVGGLVVGGDVLFINQPAEVITLAARHRVPAIYSNPRDAVAGGLMSYATDSPTDWRQVGLYAARILNGEKPADLPIWQSTKFKLVINMKTAKALGLTVPQSILVRADEVIE
jgi:putative tryptophan/tyrosine transport system substrate-binding protein